MFTAAMLGGISVSPAAAQAGQEIIVTGERIERPLEDTTSSVAVLTEDDARTRGLSRLSELMERIPNVAPVYGSGGFSIRGISNIGVSNAGEAPTVNVYIDDIPLAPTFLHAAPSDLWDVRQVEIWRGPQTTLRGQNALAGAVIVETADPDPAHFAARGRTLLSDEAERTLALAIGSPLIGGELAARVAMSLTRRDGFVRNLTRGDREDQEDRDMVRAKLLWEPGAVPGLTAKLGYTHFRRHGGYFFVYARTDRPDIEGRVATDNTPNRTDLDFDGVSAQLRYALASRLSLVSSTTWSEVHEASSFDGDFGPANNTWSEQTRDYRTLTQELRVVYMGDRLSGLAGLYWFDRSLASRTRSRTEVPTPLSTIAALLRAGGLDPLQANGLAAAYGAVLPVIPVDFNGAFPTEVRTFAAFADLRLRLTDRLSLLSGLRIDHVYGKNGTIQQAQFAGVYPTPANFGPLAPVVAQINAAVDGFVVQANGNVPGVGQGATELLPKAGLLMEWSKNVLTSFVVQRAYRPGGLSVNIARGNAFPYAAEHAWNFELALRAHLAGGRLHLNANAYWMRWRDQQVSVNFGLNAFDINTVNAGRSRLFGIETEARWQLRPGWDLRGGIGYARTRFDSFTIAQLGTPSDLSGAEFAFAPRLTLSLGSEMRWRSGVAASLYASHSSAAYGAVGANQRAFPVEPRTTVDLRLGYEGAHWSAFASVRNLLDDGAILYKSPAESRAVLAPPRTVGIELMARY